MLPTNVGKNLAIFTNLIRVETLKQPGPLRNAPRHGVGNPRHRVSGKVPSLVNR